jgi:hypothetical protein
MFLLTLAFVIDWETWFSLIVICSTAFIWFVEMMLACFWISNWNKVFKFSSINALLSDYWLRAVEVFWDIIFKYDDEFFEYSTQTKKHIWISLMIIQRMCLKKTNLLKSTLWFLACIWRQMRFQNKTSCFVLSSINLLLKCAFSCVGYFEFSIHFNLHFTWGKTFQWD